MLGDAIVRLVGVFVSAKKFPCRERYFNFCWSRRLEGCVHGFAQGSQGCGRSVANVVLSSAESYTNGKSLGYLG
jgi:hypothetical protein